VYPQHETMTQTWFGTIIVRDGKYKVMSFRVDSPSLTTEALDKSIQAGLDTGWILYHEVVCRPLVILFFSREKEETKE